MEIPVHPAGTDEPTPAPRRRGAIVAAVCVVILLAGLHLLRTALG